MLNQVLGGSGDDTLVATSANDAIWGGSAGVDTAVFSGAMADYAIQDNGDGSWTVSDLRVGAPDGAANKVRAVEYFTFSDGTYALAEFVAAQNGEIRGGAGDDMLIGTTGDDRFIASAGNDDIWGRDGTDTVVFAGSVGDYDLRTTDNGAAYLTSKIDGSVAKTRSVETYEFDDGAFTLEQLQEVLAENDVETYQGGDGADVMRGGEGADILIGGAGDDRLWGGKGGEDMAVYSGNFADYGLALGENGAYYVYDKRPGQPDGVDKVRGVELFKFNDATVTLEAFLAAMPVNPGFNINGTDGDDILAGGLFNDVLEAGAGRDRIWGRDGEDTLVLPGDFNDYVFTNNGVGAVTAVYVGERQGGGVNVLRDVEMLQFDDVLVRVGDAFDSAANIAQTSARRHVGTAADDDMNAAHTDGLVDAHTNDLMIGNGGHDTLRGGYGDDVIYGDQGPDAPQPASYTINVETDLERFSLGDGFYQIVNGQLKLLDAATGEYVDLGEKHPGFNAIGLNEADGYAYALGARGWMKGHLLRIGAEGDVEDLGDGFPSKPAGGVGPDNALYVVMNGGRLRRIDLETFEQTNIDFEGPNAPTVHDIVFIGDVAYGVSPMGVLVGYDLSSGQVSTAAIQGVPQGQGAFGAGWTSSDGGLYFSHNKTGQIFGISGVENGQPSAGVVAVGDRAQINDGFSAGSAALPEELQRVGDDMLIGNEGDDDLFGGAGNDRLDGGVGADDLFGGDGEDWADYSNAGGRVEMSLASGGTVGDAAGDTYDSVENIKGSAYNDVLEGDDGQNFIEGMDGDDVIRGAGGDDVMDGGAGADSFDGGAGFDVVSYYTAVAGVAIDMSGAGVGAGEAAGDSFANVEQVDATRFDDAMIGSSGGETLRGMSGDDVMDGGAGNDRLKGGAGADDLTGGAGNDRVFAGAGDDVMRDGAGFDSYWGQAGYDEVVFEGAYDDYTVTRIDHPEAAQREAFADLFFYTVEKIASGETDRVRDVETLTFADGYVNAADNVFTEVA